MSHDTVYDAEKCEITAVKRDRSSEEKPSELAGSVGSYFSALNAEGREEKLLDDCD